MEEKKKIDEKISDYIKNIDTVLSHADINTEVKKWSTSINKISQSRTYPIESINVPAADLDSGITKLKSSSDMFKTKFYKLLKFWYSIIHNKEKSHTSYITFYEFTDNYKNASNALKEKIKEHNVTISNEYKPHKKYRYPSHSVITKKQYKKYNYEESRNTHTSQKVDWFFHKNNQHNHRGEHSERKYKDEYSDIIEFIIFRIYDLLRCSVDKERDKSLQEYYISEGQHELSLLLKYIKKLNELISPQKNNTLEKLKVDITDTDNIPKKFNALYDYLYKHKRDILFEENRAFLQEFFKTYKLSKNDVTRIMTEEEIDKFEKFINDNDKLEYRLLKTFIPVEIIAKYFEEVDSSNGTKIVLSDAYKSLTAEELPDIHNNLNKQQILGFFSSMYIYADFKNWYWIRNAFRINNGDNLEKCSYRTEWSQSLNNFFVYLFTLNDKTLFPIRFTIDKSLNQNVYFTENINVSKNTILFSNIKLTAKLIQDYLLLGITTFTFTDKTKNTHTKYYFYFCDKDYKDIVIVDELGYVYNIGNIYEYNPITSNEFKQVVDYSKNKLYIYRFRVNELLPEKYKNVFFFTRIAKKDMSAEQLKVITDLNLENIEIERRYFLRRLYYVIISKDIMTQKGGDSKITLNLIKNFTGCDRIAGLFYDSFEKITRAHYVTNIGYNKVANEIMHLYLYPFSNYQKFWGFNKKMPDNTIRPIYEPFTYDFYSYNEIYKLYLNKHLKHIFIIGNSPGIVEVLQYYNHILENSVFINVNNYKSYELRVAFEKNIIDFITKHDIDLKVNLFDNVIYDLINQSSAKYELFIYNNFDHIKGLGINISHFNTINLFVGMLCGLKYTAIGGIFILDMNNIINKNGADIYLICKKYFEKSYLYYPEVNNYMKKNGNYAIFKGFKGISDKEFNTLLRILKTLQKYYPNGPIDSNIYESEIRERCKITKPVTGPRKPYIYGFLNTDINDDIYNEIISYNNSHYVKQLDFVEKLDALIKQNKSEPELLSQIPTNEQVFHSMMYMRKWDLAYNESLNTNKLIQSKIGTQILNDIYGVHQSLVFSFKSVYDYISIDYKKNKKFVVAINNTDNKNKNSVNNILIIPNNTINQQLLTERNKYYNKQDTVAYKLIKAYQYQLKSMILKLVKHKYNIGITMDMVELIEILKHISKTTITNVNDILIIGSTRKPFYTNFFKDKTVEYLISHNSDQVLEKSFAYSSDLIILQDIHMSQKNYYLQILAALISIKPNGTLIIKLKLPLIDYPLINLLYIMYSSVKQFKIIKPLVCDTEFYVIASNFKELESIDFDHLYITAKTYDKTYDILLDKYPEYFVSQFKYIYESLIDTWLLQSRKTMFLFDNYESIDSKTKKHIKQHIIENASDWMKKYS